MPDRPDRGYVGDKDAIPDGYASVPLTLPNPRRLLSMPQPEQNAALRSITESIADAIGRVHRAEHAAKGDGPDNDHRWTSDTASAATNVLADTYGAHPEVLIGALVEVAIFFALEEYDHEADDEPSDHPEDDPAFGADQGAR